LKVMGAQQAALQNKAGLIQQQAHGGNQHQRRKHQRGVHHSLGGNDHRPQALAGTHELGHHGSDQRQHHGHAQPGQNRGQPGRQFQAQQGLHTCSAQHAKQLQALRIHLPQARQCVFHQWEKADQRRDQHRRQHAEAEPQHKQWRQGQLGHDLADHHIGLEHALQQLGLGQSHAGQQAHGTADEQPQQQGLQGRPEMRQK
jgi:hypothetical protein